MILNSCRTTVSTAGYFAADDSGARNRLVLTNQRNYDVSTEHQSYTHPKKSVFFVCDADEEMFMRLCPLGDVTKNVFFEPTSVNGVAVESLGM